MAVMRTVIYMKFIYISVLMLALMFIPVGNAAYSDLSWKPREVIYFCNSAQTDAKKTKGATFLWCKKIKATMIEARTRLKGQCVARVIFTKPAPNRVYVSGYFGTKLVLGPTLYSFTVPKPSLKA
jgi:hypothetical protein